jgi:hypothetical protein
MQESKLITLASYFYHHSGRAQKVVFRPCRETVERFLQQLYDFLGTAGMMIEATEVEK